MTAIACAATKRSNALVEWTAFFVQVLIAISFELGDDIGRGFFSQHGTLQGATDARHIVAFEAAHGLWVEPAWQTFFQQTHHILVWSMTWTDSAHIMNAIYVGGHVFVTLGVAVWVYFYRRRFFPLWRNTIILTNLIALFVYESYPVAPPRLTTHLFFNHHAFTFQDTINGLITTGRNLVGTQAPGYNEYSAMPSIHMAWALLAGAALVILARPVAVKVLGFLYPALMLMAVVVTGNHYLLDAVGSVLVILVAVPFALSFEVWRGRMVMPVRKRARLSIPG